MKQIEIDDVVPVAKDCLIKTGRHSPQALLMTEQGLMVMILDFGSDNAKEGSAEALRNFVSKFKADRYYFISEGWAKQIEPTDVIQARASQYKDRKECLIIMEYNRDMTAKQAYIEFHREGDKIIITEEKIYREIPHEALASRFNVYLEREGVREEIALKVKEQREKAMQLLAKKFDDKYKPRFMQAQSEKEKVTILKEMVSEMVDERNKQANNINMDGGNDNEN